MNSIYEDKKKVTRNSILDALRLAGDWTLQTVQAAKQNSENGCGYRDLYIIDNKIKWQYPRSNRCTQILRWLELAEILNDQQYLDFAVDYADWMIHEPMRGICRAEHKSAEGMVWYWRDTNGYSTVYSMLLPEAFWKLGDITGREIYRDIAVTCGNTLAANQLPSGALPQHWALGGEGWSKTKALDASVNSRIGYAVGTFSFLWEKTGDDRFLNAAQRLADWIKRNQNFDGSIAENIFIHRDEIERPEVKMLFLGYLMNGFTNALALFDVDGLLETTEKIADFCLDLFEKAGGAPFISISPESYIQKNSDVPYVSELKKLNYIISNGEYHGIIRSENKIQYPFQQRGEQQQLERERTVSIYPMAGFLKLYKITHKKEYLDAAKKQLYYFMERIIDCPDVPDIHGGIRCGLADPGCWFINGWKMLEFIEACKTMLEIKEIE